MNDPARSRQALRSAAYEEALADRLGMNVTDLRALELITDEPGMTPGRLAERSGLTTGAVTGVLDRLEKGGYVERTADQNDRRRQVVQPTAAAAAARASIGRIDQTVEGLLADYPPDQQQAIRAFLDASAAAVSRQTEELRASVHGGFVGHDYRAPLAGATRGRLVFASGAPRLSLNVAPLGPRAAARMIMETSASRLEFDGVAPESDLLGGSFDGPLPDVRASGGVVSVRYKRGALALLTTREAQMALSGVIPWAIEIEGGLTDLSGSLAGVNLERLEVNGGANHLELELPRPGGTMIVRVNGVVSDARFVRPRGVPISVRVAGGIGHLKLDGQRHEQIGGERRFTSADFSDATDRIELEILGGANTLRIRAA